MAKRNDIQKLEGLAREMRLRILEMTYKAKSAHIGSAFSIVEILVALYFQYLNVSPADSEKKDRDRFVLSKGHGCPALYAVLCKRGFIPSEVLSEFSQDDGLLERHPVRNLKFGIENTAGSLGHGLSVAAGMAMASKLDKIKNRICVLMGDGEINEGSVWEAAMFASHHKLSNLIAMVDYNKIQALGDTAQVLDLEPLADKWRAFGWAVREVKGHDLSDILGCLKAIPFEKGRPSMMILHTTKGRGVSFMENNLLWHYRCPDKEEYAEAVKELS